MADEESASVNIDFRNLLRGAFTPPAIGRVVAMLVAGELNHHLLNCNGDDDPVTEWKPWLGCDGCCPECCAPCNAMAWLRDNANDALTQWLNDWNPNPNGRWDWQLPDGSVNWEMVERHWKPEQLQCHDEEDLMRDEPLDKVLAAYDAGVKGVTAPPADWVDDETMKLEDVQAAFNRLPVISEETTIDLGDVDGPVMQAAFDQLQRDEPVEVYQSGLMLPGAIEAAARQGYVVTLHNDELTPEELAEVQARFDASPVAATVAEFLANPSSGVRVQRPERHGSTVPEGYSFHE